MNLLSIRPSLLVASLATLAPAALLTRGLPSDPVDLVYQVPANQAMEVCVRQASTSTMQSSVWYPVVDNEIVEEGEFAFDMAAESATEIEITFTDRFGSLNSDGVLVSLERTFDSLDATMDTTSVADGEETSEASAMVSPLFGRVVRFEWDGDDESYGAAFSSDDGEEATDFDEALLASQAIDAFGDWYLPSSDALPVKAGDTWDAGVDAWHRTLDIGGDFWIGPQWEDAPTEQEVGARRLSRAQLRSGGDGDVRCTYVGMREMEGRELAVIEVVVDVTVQASTTEEHEEQDSEGDLATIQRTLTTDLQWTGKGEFLWDTDAKLPHTLSLDMELVATTLTVEVPAADVEAAGNAWREVWETATTVLYTFRSDT